MDTDIVRADPAGNITIFVRNPPDSKKDRMEMAQILLADPELKAEQVGFIFPPQAPGELWRLDMAGGEFCGNASRSLGLLAALESELRGKHTIMIHTSGLAEAVPVYVDTEARTAEIVIPGPVCETEIFWEGRRFAVYEFEGITHIIADNIPADEQCVRALIREYKKPCSALGVMFFNSHTNFTRPAVWVRETDTLVFESSCGSGSAALGVWAVRNESDAERELELAQPGGAITVKVRKQAGKITRLSIGGEVELSEKGVVRREQKTESCKQVTVG